MAGFKEVAREVAREQTSPLDALRKKSRAVTPETMVVSGVITFTVSSAVVLVGDGQACIEIAQHVIQRLVASPRFGRVVCLSQSVAIAQQEWAKDLTSNLACSFDSVEDVAAKIEEAGGGFDTALVLMGETREEGGMLWGGEENELSRGKVTSARPLKHRRLRWVDRMIGCLID